MALTLLEEQKLSSIRLTDFFQQNKVEWVANVQDCYDHAKKSFPLGSKIRPDDVKKVMLPSVEVHPGLKLYLAQKRCSQLYWFGYFTNLVIERTWEELDRGG